jgi:hypothetical protein
MFHSEISLSCFSHLTAGFIDLKNSSASFDAFATKAACCGSLRLPIVRDEFPVGVAVVLPLTTIPEVDVNGLIPRLSPSSSLMTVIRGEKRHCEI